MASNSAAIASFMKKLLCWFARSYLARYTHGVAISDQRLVAADEGGVAFRWKDYRLDGPDRWKTMKPHPHGFIRRFLMQVLPSAPSGPGRHPGVLNLVWGGFCQAGAAKGRCQTLAVGAIDAQAEAAEETA